MVTSSKSEKTKILIVDNDPGICLQLTNLLTKHNYSITSANTGAEALKLLRLQSYELILCDNTLPGSRGVELLQKMKKLNPRVPVVITTGSPDVKSVVKAFRSGASDYLIKPLDPKSFLKVIQEIGMPNNLIQANNKDYNSSTKQNASLLLMNRKNSASTKFIIGKSTQSKMVQRNIELIAPSDISVIITGETGTGKEYVAQSIHKLSNRSNYPFIAIDCGALPSDLAGSELFGHMKGSFTGAIIDKPGSFELANGGTIFLDEIGNLSYENQIKLLRVIQERKIKRVGGLSDKAIDVRLIAATNEDLSKTVRDGRLREDLYYRLNEFKIELVPLRERTDDIMFYAEFFLQKANQALNKNVKAFADLTRKYLETFCWQGNLRELNNVVRRAVLLTSGDIITPDTLPADIQSGLAGNQDIYDNVGLLKAIAWTAERQAIVETLERVKFNKSRASELLNIDRKTLYNKLKLYSITQ